jgi:hypothetical protein
MLPKSARLKDCIEAQAQICEMLLLARRERQEWEDLEKLLLAEKNQILDEITELRTDEVKNGSFNDN